MKITKIYPRKCKCDRILPAIRYRNKEWICGFCAENIPLRDTEAEKQYLERQKMLLTFPIPKELKIKHLGND